MPLPQPSDAAVGKEPGPLLGTLQQARPETESHAGGCGGAASSGFVVSKPYQKHPDFLLLCGSGSWARKNGRRGLAEIGVGALLCLRSASWRLEGSRQKCEKIQKKEGPVLN